MLKQIFDGWQAWIFFGAGVFFESSQPYISFVCFFVFGLMVSRDFYMKKYSKKIDFLVSKYSATLYQISSNNPEVIQRFKEAIEYNDLEKSHPKNQRKLSDEQIANGELLKKVITKFELFNKQGSIRSNHLKGLSD